MDDVVLNIYDLLPAPAGAGSQPGATATSQGLSTFLSGLLAPLGFGAYHTSIDVRGFRYQWAGNGITRSSSPRGGGNEGDVPPNVAFKESIIVGQTWFEQKEINQIVSRMREDKWKGVGYHLANRNCNHFSETFALALVKGEELVEGNAGLTLESYPKWVNRLAKTGTSLGIDDGEVCDINDEARRALGNGKVGWSITPSQRDQQCRPADGKRSRKKELTDKQKAALAKLKAVK
mmetsp:Transcript_3893/g.8734  ORF Transcript_3893/g.8734 Transcript_3893/m.8734 type:complete len:234 (+) Transcript_3893:60-761(+)